MNKQISHPNNRFYKPDQEISEFLYDLYKLLYSSKLDLRIKQRTFETAAESKNSWKVVSISENAVEFLVKNGTATGLRRGHIMPRIVRAKYMFENGGILEKDELIRFFFENDTVALVTSKENSINGTDHWSKLIETPAEMFNVGTFSIYARKRIEIPWVMGLKI